MNLEIEKKDETDNVFNFDLRPIIDEIIEHGFEKEELKIVKDVLGDGFKMMVTIISVIGIKTFVKYFKDAIKNL